MKVKIPFIPYNIRTLLAFIMFLVLLFAVSVCTSSCSTTEQYAKRKVRKADHRISRVWLRENGRGIEKYTYASRVWPSDERCSTYDSGRQPTKISSIRRLHFARRPRR